MRKILACSGRYTRVRKDVARKLFDDGKDIYLTPSNIAANDGNITARPFRIHISDASRHDSTWGFDEWVNAFEYYNCNHALGYYTNFWIIEED